jgi:serine/threonine-protein kinase
MTEAFDRLKSALANRYTIERELGRGGMATVYLAEDLKLLRKVALKVLRPELALAVGPDRFLREIDIAAKLSHPHILPLHDCGEADGFLYYVMPYVEGQSLREKLTKEGELPIVDAVRIIRDVVEAMKHAHRHNVVHRDIKPDNVMLAEDHALVTDFGIAKAVSDATGASGLTTEGGTRGTPAYMSPEQASGDPHIDHRADIYAVGALAYELLTGRTPFVMNTQQELLAAHVTQIPEPVTKYRGSVPPALAELVTKCLEKRAADRWQTAEELLPQLEALATPSGGVTPTGMVALDDARRGWRIAVPASVATVILAVVLVVTLLPRGGGVALDRERIVVAVFRNATGDPALDHIGERAGHWITQGVQQAAIPVTPWDQALQSWEYVLTEAEGGRIRDPVRALAGETGAGIVISGTVYAVGSDSLEVQVNVTDAEHGRMLGTLDPLRGARVSDSDLIEDAQQRVMVFLAARLDERLRDAPAAMVGDVPSFEAYEAFVEGLGLHHQGAWEEAAQYYRRATELAPTWAQPLLRMRGAFSNLDRWAEYDSVLQVLENFGDRLTPYEQAVVRGGRARHDGDFDEELRSYRRVAELGPGSIDHYILGISAYERNRPQEAVDVLSTFNPERGWVRNFHWHSLHLTRALHMLGEHERALEEARRFRKLDPEDSRRWDAEIRALAALGHVRELNEVLEESASASDPSWTRRAFVHGAEILRAGRHEDAADDVVRRALEWFDARPPGEAQTMGHRSWRGWGLFLAGRYQDAQEVYDALVDESPDSVSFRGRRAFIAATRGDTARAKDDAEWLKALDRPHLRGEHTLYRGVISGALRKRDEAVTLLRQAYEQGRSYSWYDLVRVDLAPLRDYPPFQELMRPKG